MSEPTPTRDPVAEGAAAGEDTFERVVLVIGSTGNGKSTVCNILYDGDNLASNFFPESEYARSETKGHRVGKVRTGNMKLTIIDTIGIGDSDLTHEQVCMQLAHAINACKGGIHQLLFVLPGKLSTSEQEAFSLIKTVLMNANVVKYTTIVRSKFGAFRDDSRVQKDLESMKGIRDGELYREVAKIIHVDNPSAEGSPDWQERRRASRERLITRIAACSDLYLPPELQDISARIAEVQQKEKETERAVEKNRELVAQLEDAKAQGKATAEMMAQLTEANKQTGTLIAQMREEQKQSEQRIAHLMANRGGGGGRKRCTIQ